MEIRELAKTCKMIASGTNVPPEASLSLSAPKALEVVLRKADMQRVTPLIVHYLSKNMQQSALSEQTQAYLTLKNPRLARARAVHLKAQLLDIDAALEGTHIHPVLLKGSIQIFWDLYPSIALREMADIDVMSTDPAFSDALRKRGYKPIEDGNAAQTLLSGEHHLPPLAQPQDLVAVEPHILPVAPRYAHLIPANFETNVLAVSGCKNLKRPSLENHLIHVLIHAIKHDRDTLGSGLVLRGLLEAELIFERLNSAEKEKCEAHFKACNASGFWTAWRDLADWTFHDQKRARFHSIRAFFLITEFELRSKGHLMVFLISSTNRLFSVFSTRYWQSQTFKKHYRRYVKKDFWERILSHLSTATKK